MLFAFNCYCSHCRQAYKDEGGPTLPSGSCSTVSCCWRSQCRLSGNGEGVPPELTFHDTSSPYLPCTGVSRGVCSTCSQPIISRGKGLFFLFSFVNHTLFGGVVQPSYFFFYGSRSKELTPAEAKDCAVPAYVNDFVSIMACTWIICKAVVLHFFGVDCVKTATDAKADGTKNV